MAKSDSDIKPRSTWWSAFSWLDSVDFIVYGGLGAALLCYFAYKIGQTIWSTNSLILESAYVIFLAGTLALAIRDIRQRKFSTASWLLVGAWSMCVAFIILLEFFL